MNDILGQLKTVAPSVAFSVSREIDPNFTWDGGDGEEPSEDYAACDVTVSACVIIAGERIEACDYLGGSYFRDDEPCGDVHGYLPQMLGDAAQELQAQLGERGLLDVELATQLHNAIAAIQGEMRARYDEQMAAASKGAR